MMGTEIFKIDASWAEKLTKTRVSFLMTPTVIIQGGHFTAGPARGGKIDGDGDVLIPQQVEPF